MGKIKKYNMELEVLTPLHIAGAKELNKKEYLFDKNEKTLRIIDTNKFTALLVEKNLFNRYIDYVEDNRNKNNDIKYFLEKNNILSNLKDFTKKKYVNLKLSTDDIKNGIKLLNRDIENKPYIQGSSIKGAIINNLLVDYIINNREEFRREKQKILNLAKTSSERDLRSFKKEIEKFVLDIEEKILNKKMKNPKTKILGISISDTYKTFNDKVNFFQDIDKKYKDRKEQFMPVLREYIMPKSKFYFDINIDFDLLTQTKLNIKNYDDFIGALESATDYLTKNTLNFSSSESRQNLILGANTGYHQKTIIHALFEDKKERTEVVKKILHKGRKNLIGNHINDKNSPRVINGVKINNEFEIAGLVEIRKIGEKNVGTN